MLIYLPPGRYHNWFKVTVGLFEVSYDEIIPLLELFIELAFFF